MLSNDNVTICECVRVLIVSGFQYDPGEDTYLLQFLIQRLTKLQTIGWRVGFLFSDSLLNDLASRDPVPRLYYKGRINSLTRSPSLLNCVAIRSLKVNCYTAAQVDAVRPVVFALPCLDRLSIKMAYIDHRDPVSYVFSPRPGEIMPPVRTLCFTNISFHPQQTDGWAECVQHDTLRHLGLDGSLETMDLLTCLTGCVAGLTSLAIRINCSTYRETRQVSNRLGPFLSEVSCLTAFTGYNLSKRILPTVVSRHGSHLQRLRFRGTPYTLGFRVRNDCHLSSHNIRNLASDLPNLHRLGIHLKVGDQLPYDTLTAISQFPRLQYVEINTDFDHGPVSEVPLVEDLWFDVFVVEEAFRHIATEKKRSTLSQLPLKGLDFKRYDWGPHIGSHNSLCKNPAVPVYACRWAGGGSQGEQVRVFPVWYNKMNSIIGDESYEESLVSAGLWDLASLLEGPWIL